MLTPSEIEALEPTYIGPTWQRDCDGKWLLPKATLGWEIAGWCAKYLLGEDGEPWRFTKEQLRFVLWWYAVDETGRFIYRKGVLQRMKGWGKDPLLAVLCLVELVGPSRFSHWEDGEPVAKPHPQAWVQVTAVNQSQTTNTMALIPSLMSDLLKETYSIVDGAVLIRANGGRCRLVAVTSSYRSLEGGRTTFTLLNETHHWVSSNNGHKLYDTIDGNATKKDSRYLAITNAYLPGEDSVAERMRESWEKIEDGKAVDVGFLYDSLEAHEKTPLTAEALRIVLPKIRGDAVWLRVETIIQSIQDTTIAPSRSRRMWLNQIVAEEDALYTKGDWDPLGDPTLMLSRGDEVTLGFDGGKTDDATALVAVRVSDSAAFLIGLWERPDGPRGEGWVVPREDVDEAVRSAFEVFEVAGFYSDVAYWESYIADWSADFREGLRVKSHAPDGISWDMRASVQKSTRAHERLVQAILDGKITHSGDRDLRRHILNVRRRTNSWGVSFGKESKDSPKKIDAYAALMLAYECRNDLLVKGKTVKKKTGRGYFL